MISFMDMCRNSWAHFASAVCDDRSLQMSEWYGSGINFQLPFKKNRDGNALFIFSAIIKV